MPRNAQLIVVAIRGTASIHDWLVNFNTGEHSDTSAEDEDSILNGNNYRAHAGFLACTMEMLPEACKAITKAATDFRGGGTPRTPWDLHLVLTGYSAGGAVAAMLYAQFMQSQAAPTAQPSIPREELAGIHCVTFGAPPITTTPIVPFAPDSLFLSIVNEGDPIPRADSPYFDDLLKIVVTGWPTESRAKWQLSPRKYFNAGTVLIVPRGRSVVYFLPSETGNGSLAETIMGNPGMHRMRWYLEGQGGQD
ncbi:Alpha/Beta hydrolase protein [Staphylotrichum tortipilum]|uniref:sn-1-specific diacylglycerol lipase n=1 Tax=Staphylotrichum tortipilum TaxID=2831512 RepID=A0AAN6MHT7_9PEZI|nr:Alpha/Beta hydrolase protein [Staphylotrichum longicolle]